MRIFLFLILVVVFGCGKSYPTYPVKTVDMQQRMYQHHSQEVWEQENADKIKAFRETNPEGMYNPNPQ